MGKSDSKFPAGISNDSDSRSDIKGKEDPKKFKQSDNKKYKDNAIYKVTLKKGGSRDLDIRGKYFTFEPRKETPIKGKYLNHSFFRDQESYFTIIDPDELKKQQEKIKKNQEAK
jgi:hypothetical protein